MNLPGGVRVSRQVFFKIMKGTRTQRKHEIKGLNSCSQSMNLQLKKMNILKFGAMMIC